MNASGSTSTAPHTCRICGNQEHNIAYQVREMMLGLRDEHPYFECAACGCLQIAEVPANLPDYYPSDAYYSYASINKSNQGNPLKHFLIRNRDRYAATGEGLIGRLMQRLQPHDKLPCIAKANVSLNSAILDVGCGAGHLLHSMKEAGFTQLLGIDPFNENDIAYQNGLRIEKKSIHRLEKQQATGDWDLIMFNHSFEHVMDQHDTLKKVFELLKPGAVCLIRVPTVTSWAWRTYGTDWVQLDAPRHFFLHSIKSLHLLAEQTGFVLQDVIYDSFAFQYWGSQQYQQDIALNDANSYAVNPDASPFKRDDIREFEKMSQQLNRDKAGDQAAFYLRKPL